MRSLVSSYTDDFLKLPTTKTILIVPQTRRAPSPIELNRWILATDVHKIENYLISPVILIKVHVEEIEVDVIVVLIITTIYRVNSVAVVSPYGYHILGKRSIRQSCEFGCLTMSKSHEKQNKKHLFENHFKNNSLSKTK